MLNARQSGFAFAAFAVASLLLCTPFPAETNDVTDRGETVLATRVITFHPEIPHGTTRKGHCWTQSDAIDRPGAWRCMADDSIYDPCFSDPGLSYGVICGADPARGHPGFVLELTKPLPTPRGDYQSDAIPWLVKLADGSICELTTGTSAQVDGKDLPYECSDSRDCSDDGTCPYLTAITTEFKRGKVWRVEKFAFKSSRGGIKRLKRQTVAIVAVWK